jgi:hypothetical protein
VLPSGRATARLPCAASAGRSTTLAALPPGAVQRWGVNTRPGGGLGASCASLLPQPAISSAAASKGMRRRFRSGW